jgi:lipoprotein Spr
LKRSLVLFTIACISISLLNSCHSRKKAAARLSLQSKKTNTYRRPATTAQNRPKKPAEPIRKAPDAYTLRKKYASILGISPVKISNYPLYQFIDRWYGTPYCIGGCDAKGIDCSGFAQKLYRDVYKTDLVRTALQQFRNCKRFKNTAEAIEGDLVFFSIHSKNITHVGIYLANNHFVHASTSGGVMISSLREEYWSKYYSGCGRVPKS